MKVMDFLKEYEFTVEVFDGELGDIGSAVLVLGPEKWAHLAFKSESQVRALPMGQLENPLKAVSSEGIEFTLFDCKRFDLSVGVGCVVTGHVPEKFKKIIIRYSEVSEWCLPWGGVDVDIEDISWVAPAHISTKIKIEGVEVLLTTDSERSVRRDGEDSVFHQHVIFCLESTGGHFSSDAVKESVIDLSNLLSILIARPLSVISVSVIDDGGFSRDFLFSTFKPIERDSSDNLNWAIFFTQYSFVHERQNEIFSRYFESEYRKASWARLAGMQRYEGFWEYLVLGNVSLLDRYVGLRKKGRKINVPVSDRKVDRLKERIEKIRPALIAGQRDEVVSAVNCVFSHVRDTNFSEKYLSVLSESNADVVKVINISDSNFTLIKGIRDKIAHGESVYFEDGDFTPVITIVSKIALLMTYWFFIDIGLSDDDFLGCLDFTHSQLKLRADPDRVHLDRVKRPNHFLSVTDLEFEKISRFKGVKLSACFVRSKSGKVRFSKKYSDKEAGWRAGKNIKSGVISHSDIFKVDKDRIDYLSPIYVQSGDKILNISYGFIIQAM